jgi:hypothetical protein
MKTNFRWIFIPICIFFLCLPAHASTGTYSMSFVELISTVKAEALSNCVTALPEKDALFVNPAAISLNTNFSVSAQLFNYVEDIQYKQIRLLKSFRFGNIAFSYTFLDYGNYLITTVSDKQGGSSGTIENKSSSLHLTYAKKMNKLNLGFTTKYIQDKLYLHSANQLALDIGVQYIFSSRLSLGASSSNISLTKAKYINQKAHMRRIDRIGLVYSPSIFRKSCSYYFDLIYLNDDSINFSAGTSLKLHEKLYLYLGKENVSDIHDFSIGLSVNSNLFELDFSYKPNSVFNDTYRVGLTVGL